MRLIADGVVDREGVRGPGQRVGYTPRHLTRLLTAELGAGPLALARARRAQTARVLIETTELGFADVAFAAGFASVRQFNDTVREVYAASPTELRGRRGRPGQPGRGDDAARRAHAVRRAGGCSTSWPTTWCPGVEVAGDGWYARTLDLPHGPGTVRLELADAPEAGETAFVTAALRAARPARHRRRRRAGPPAGRRRLRPGRGRRPVRRRPGDRAAGPRARPGCGVPGQVDGDETAIRTVIGQQVSVAGACTVGRPARRRARAPVDTDVAGLTHLFPDAATLAAVDPATLPMPRARGRALVGLAAALADGRGRAGPRPRPRRRTRCDCSRCPAIGPWTADYVAMRALAHPDVFLPTDIGVRNALVGLGHDPVGRGRRQRPLAAVALLRPDAPVEHPDA